MNVDQLVRLLRRRLHNTIMTHFLPHSKTVVRNSLVGKLFSRQPRQRLSQLSVLPLTQPSKKSLPSCVAHHNLTGSLASLHLATVRRFSVEINEVTYEQVSEETLESLSEVLEELIDSDAAPPDSDVLYSTGVLTLHLGAAGTYVINKQSPNKQLWLSSPRSGPKRFDFHDTAWLYKHTGDTLHGLLSQELSQIFGASVDLSNCAYSGLASDVSD